MKIFVTMCALLLVAGTALAAEPKAGVAETQVVAKLIESNYGLLLGLVIAAIGGWMFITKGSSWGIAMIVLGVAVTAFPGLFQGAMQGLSPFVQTAGGTTVDPRFITQ